MSLQSEKLAKSINTLDRLGMIQENENGIVVVKPHVHLSAQSVLCKPHQQLMRNLSESRLQQIDNTSTLNVSITFTADQNAAEEVRKELMLCLKKLEVPIIKAPSKEAYQINLDFFSWTKN